MRRPTCCKRTPWIKTRLGWLIVLTAVGAAGCQGRALPDNGIPDAPAADAFNSNDNGDMAAVPDTSAGTGGPADSGTPPDPAPVDAPLADDGGMSVPVSAALSLNISFMGDDSFARQGQECLDEIASYGGFGKELLEPLGDTPITVINRPSDNAHGTFSGELGTPPRAGAPITITTGTIMGKYGCDDALKDWCAEFFHELQHADDLYRGRQFSDEEYEARGVRAENWLLAQRGLCQRNCYDSEDASAPQFAPDFDVLWDIGPGECKLALTVVNETPDWILVSALSGKILCGSDNPYYRAEGEPRACTTRLERTADNNPYAVQLVTLIAYFPSGDPSFPFGGRVEWYDEAGEREPCGNAFSEYCQIAMGTDGEFPELARDHSRTIRVRYAAGQ